MNRQKNILHIATALSWRGGEQQLAYLVDELKHDLNNIVLCSKGSELEKYCQSKGVNYFSQTKRGGFDLLYALRIKQICKKLEVDLIHVHDAHAHTFAILAAVLGNNCPVVLSRRVDFPVKNKWTSSFKYNHACIKKILCVSKTIKEITAPAIQDKSKLEVVYSGIDLEKFSPSTGKLRSLLGVSQGVKLIGNTSALADHKDYFTFIDTAKLLVDQGFDGLFVVMGDGPLKDEIHEYVANQKLENHFKFTGYRNDVPSLLADFDLFLITSKTEGLGTSILDAFACKVPVVATAAGGIPELVEDGKTGLLRKVKDSSGLASAVLELMNSKEYAEKLSNNAFEKVKQFSKQETAKQSLKYYLEIIS